MAKKTPKEIDEKIKVVRWLHWECLRRNQDYQNDVREVLRVANEKSNNTEVASFVKKAYSRICKTYKRINELFFDLNQEEIKLLTKEFFLRGKFKQRKEIEKSMNYGRKHLQVRIALSEGKCLEPKSLKLTSELMEFQRKWGIKFPISHTIGVPIDCLMDSPPLHYKYNPDTNILSINLKLNTYKEIIMARLKDIIDECFPKGYYGTERIQNKEVYETIFKVWDLREKEHKKWREIAIEIYPDDKSPDSALRKVMQHHKQAKKLIKEVDARIG